MIVDDSALIRARIQNEYNKSKFAIIAEAKDGQDALELYIKFHPDVVTMDITMPNLDGIEAIQKLVAIDPSIKILVISALNDKATGMEALEKGAMGFIHKPFTAEELCEALELIVEDD